jgi:hypothetical protein
VTVPETNSSRRLELHSIPPFHNLSAPITIFNMEHTITEGERNTNSKKKERKRERERVCVCVSTGKQELEIYTSAILKPFLPLLCHHVISLIDEAALYDRQIRLWGLEAQHRQVRNGTFFL